MNFLHYFNEIINIYTMHIFQLSIDFCIVRDKSYFQIKYCIAFGELLARSPPPNSNPAPLTLVWVILDGE